MNKMNVIRSLAFALLLACMGSAPAFAQIGVGVSLTVAPPDLPVYDQPVCPDDGYIWTPGYWAWGDDGYFWVPGTWVLPPEPGLFWTPGYWAWGGNAFIFNAGYWGPVVGFYGGVDYGFGYFGHGYEGGRWQGGHFFYNRAVNNVNVTVVRNTYNTRIDEANANRVSYNGGRGGLNVRASQEEESAARARRAGPVAAQTQQRDEARSNESLRASVNHGRPPIAATPRAGAFNDHAAVPAREGGTVHGSEARPENNSRPSANTPVHANDVPAAQRPAPPNTGNAKLDQKYQKQQDKMATQQAKDQQKLQQRQDKEHQQAAKRNANDAQKQQMEQRHQQQTQQMQQRHEQQSQHLEQRQHAAPQRTPHQPQQPQHPHQPTEQH